MRILAIGDPHGKIPRNLPRKNIDLILITGDIGKSDLAKKIYFMKNKKEITASKREQDAAHKEIYDSTIRLLKKISAKKEVYLIMGNVATRWSKLIRRIKKMRNVHLVKNSFRRINGLKIGFLEFFIDVSWINEFKERDKSRVNRARKETIKARRTLERFGKIDILVCHQPPYGVLDKVNTEYDAPKQWNGKHAGSKVVLDYTRKYQPRYVFCGHIHEGKGMKRVGKTEVYNLGVAGYKIINF